MRPRAFGTAARPPIARTVKPTRSPPIQELRATPLTPAMSPEASLFARADQSVRLVCEAGDSGVLQLQVCGPKDKRATYTFNDAVVCEQFRTALEVGLLRAGFERLHTGERRARGGRRSTAAE